MMKFVFISFACAFSIGSFIQLHAMAPENTIYTLQILTRLKQSTDKSPVFWHKYFDCKEPLNTEFNSKQTYHTSLYSTLFGKPEPYHTITRYPDTIAIESVLPIVKFGSFEELVDHVSESEEQLHGTAHEQLHYGISSIKSDAYSKGEYVPYVGFRFDNPAMRYKTNLSLDDYARLLAMLK